MRKIFLLFVFGIFLIGIVSAANYCCERTTSGAFCQNVGDKAQCDSNYKTLSTFCASTSYCAEGTCIDQKEGTCMPSTERVCTANNGFWSPNKKSELPQCKLGCCLIGDQASFVTQVACNRYGVLNNVDVNFQSSINDELTCLASANPQAKGACVFQNSQFQTDCLLTTKKDCQDKAKSSALGNVSFHEGFLCSAQELGTICGKTQNTICGDDGNVYFQDSCKQQANIYDSSKVNDENYWTRIQAPTCGDGKGNKDSSSCGSCDYYSGSMCKAKKTGDSVTYGNNLCKSLDCKDYRGIYGEGIATPNNKASASNYPKHGETWCATDSVTGDANAPGATTFKLACYNGEVTYEECDGTRQKVCSESTDAASGFKSANCKTNIWTDCWSMTKQSDCEDINVRDCKWINSNGYQFTNDSGPVNTGVSGICVPNYAPGFERNNNQVDPNNQVVKSCGTATAICYVRMEKPFLGDWKCSPDSTFLGWNGKNNCSCLSSNWQTQMNNICTTLGDCGTKKNYAGIFGYVHDDIVKIQTVSSD